MGMQGGKDFPMEKYYKQDLENYQQQLKNRRTEIEQTQQQVNAQQFQKPTFSQRLLRRITPMGAVRVRQQVRGLRRDFTQKKQKAQGEVNVALTEQKQYEASFAPTFNDYRAYQKAFEKQQLEERRLIQKYETFGLLPKGGTFSDKKVSVSVEYIPPQYLSPITTSSLKPIPKAPKIQTAPPLKPKLSVSAFKAPSLKAPPLQKLKTFLAPKQSKIKWF